MVADPVYKYAPNLNSMTAKLLKTKTRILVYSPVLNTSSHATVIDKKNYPELTLPKLHAFNINVHLPLLGVGRIEKVKPISFCSLAYA